MTTAPVTFPVLAPVRRRSRLPHGPRAGAPRGGADRRDDIKMLEAVLTIAVKNGADKLALQMQTSEPGSLFVTDTGRAARLRPRGLRRVLRRRRADDEAERASGRRAVLTQQDMRAQPRELHRDAAARPRVATCAMLRARAAMHASTAACGSRADQVAHAARHAVRAPTSTGRPPGRRGADWPGRAIRGPERALHRGGEERADRRDAQATASA